MDWTRHPPILLIHSHSHFRFIDFVTPTFTCQYSLGMAQYPQYKEGSARMSKDSGLRRAQQGERSGESTGLKWVLAVSKWDLNRILFSAGESLRAPQPGFESCNSEGRVVRIDPARPPQSRDTHSTGMRFAQRASGRVRSGSCPWK